MFYETFVLIISLSYCLYSSKGHHNFSKDFELELVQTIFRHGERVPIKTETYPNDPYIDLDFYPYGYGQLTNDGKRHAYEIGQMLRKRYGTFLDEYKAGDIYAYSTPTDRTKMTLQLVLAGLYPPSLNLTWSQDLHWIPIPTYSNSPNFDFLSTMIVCPEYARLLVQTINLVDVQAKFDKYKDFADHLLNSTGLTMDYRIVSFIVYGAIRNQKNYNLPLPSWCTQDDFKTLEEIIELLFDISSYTDTLNQLAAGPLLKTFVRNIENSNSKNSTKKIYAYSASDINILPYLRSHGINTPRIINYAYTVVLEKLKGNDNQTYIRMLVWPGEGEHFNVIKLAGCDEICSLAQYLEIIRPVLPYDEGTQCLYEMAYKRVPDVINEKISQHLS